MSSVDKFVHITIFDHPYPREKQAEGLAISRAIVSGACNQCPVLGECSTNKQFVFPASAWCMKEKARILRE